MLAIALFLSSALLFVAMTDLFASPSSPLSVLVLMVFVIALCFVSALYVVEKHVVGKEMK